MAQIAKLNPEAWAAWLAERPESIRALANRLTPDRLYRMRSTGQRVTIISYAEDGTVRVYVSGQFNFLAHEIEVYGVDANDLEECDLPDMAEILGAVVPNDGANHGFYLDNTWKPAE